MDAAQQDSLAPEARTRQGREVPAPAGRLFSGQPLEGDGLRRAEAGRHSQPLSPHRPRLRLPSRLWVYGMGLRTRQLRTLTSSWTQS